MHSVVSEYAEKCPMAPQKTKLDHFQLTLRVSSPLSNNNLAPADHGSH